ncbi:MAG TPA: glycosyltransferase family 4 protein [Sandaracinaceae bacterium LLY-WYZ-13_1]|nr:glycosyltransferase family 4 protein [Sandaracinaceae bacterium LLY-WYZ-13_1]
MKGTAELFAAIDRVVAHHPGARFVLAGGLPDHPRGERRWRERFEREASDPARAATTFAGWLGPEALARAHDDAAILVAPSWHETYGLAVAEAMARGLAVVASDAGALPERVTHGVDGLLVPPRDPAALADAIGALLDDPARLARMRAAARRHHRASPAPFLDAYAEARDGA